METEIRGPKGSQTVGTKGQPTARGESDEASAYTRLRPYGRMSTLAGGPTVITTAACFLRASLSSRALAAVCMIANLFKHATQAEEDVRIDARGPRIRTSGSWGYLLTASRITSCQKADNLAARRE